MLRAGQRVTVKVRLLCRGCQALVKAIARNDIRPFMASCQVS